MKNIFTLLLFLSASCFAVRAQSNMQLKFVRDLPKDLFSAPTAVLIGYTTNVDITPEENASIISEYSTRLLTDNQHLGLQLIHFADKNALAQPATKRRLLRQYDSLKIENLLFLNITDIKGTGAQGSYVLTHTAFNQRATITSSNQKAFVLQADTYEKLIRNFKTTTEQFGPHYFKKAPESERVKPVLTAEPTQETMAPGQENTPEKTLKPLAYPLISLSTLDNLLGGKQTDYKSYFYYLGADQRERKAGFFGQHLRKDVAASPEAVKELDKYRNYKIANLAERAVFVTAVALYGNEVLSGDDYTYFNDKQKVYLGVAAGSLLVHILIRRNTSQHMLRAIDEYNAFATIKNHSSFHKLKPSGFGFGAVCNQKTVPGISLSWQLR